MTSIRFPGSMRPAPFVAAVGVAAVIGVVPAHADSGSNNLTDSGSISAAVEKFGQSLCPSLVKPGASLATTLSELQGNTGLTPTLTGMVASFVIQTQCPGVMSKLAKGDLSALNLTGKESAPSGLDLSALLTQPSQATSSGLDLAALLKPASPEPPR